MLFESRNFHEIRLFAYIEFIIIEDTMKKVVFTCLSVLMGFLSMAQNGEFIFINPTEVSDGILYKLPDGTGSYTVLPKNTLYSISKLHNMSVEELQSLNGISGTTILIGQKLKVKATETIGKGLAFGSKSTGSSVNSVLEKSHLQITSVGELEVSANHPAILRAKKLKEEGIDLEEMKGTHVQRENQWWYVANDEDNFHLIATKYDMSFDVLKDNNELNDYLYRKGMVLLVEPGKLYGIKMMPENMPDRPKEEVKVLEKEVEKVVEKEKELETKVVDNIEETTSDSTLEETTQDFEQTW